MLKSPRATRSPTVQVPAASSDQSFVRSCLPPVVSNGRQALAASSTGMKLQESLFKLERAFSPSAESRSQITAIRDQPLFRTLLPVRGQSVDDLASQIQKREELAAKLWSVFQAKPVEDGINHPGEVTIREALQSMDGYPVLEWLKMFSVDTNHPHFAASVLRCLGRQHLPGTISWRMEVVRKAFSTDAVDIRDAAAQAAESWGGLEMRDVLQEHTDPVPWLQDYILDILNDIQS